MNKNFRFDGRYIENEEKVFLCMSGSSIEFTVNGIEAEFDIEPVYAVIDKNFCPRYKILINGKLYKACSARFEKIKIKVNFNILNIKIILISEAVYGGIAIKNIKGNFIDSPKKNLCIGFVGDSITCGYGIGGKVKMPFSTETEDFTKSYAYITAENLNAEYDNVSYSGFGIVSGFSENGMYKIYNTIPELYEYCGYVNKFHKKWNFENHICDFIVLNLGTNDENYIYYNFQKRSNEFIDKYIEFLKLIRLRNKNSIIICSCGTMTKRDVFSLIVCAVNKYKILTNDKNIFTLEFDKQDKNDGLTVNYHPSEITQRKAAGKLTKFIKNIIYK